MVLKALIHLVPRAGSGDMFEARVREVVQRLREAQSPGETDVNLLLRLADDPFGRRTSYRAAIELCGRQASVESLGETTEGVGRLLEDVAHLDLSSLLLGDDNVIVASQRTPVRYQYLMRRNTSFTHDGYLKRYREVHAQFGIDTPGISGYVQFHVDAVASRRAAAAAGFGVWAVDSVSELYLESLETFLGKISRSSIGPAAIADEEIFVDRANSYDLVTHVEWQP
jgi:hypothetical protein